MLRELCVLLNSCPGQAVSTTVPSTLYWWLEVLLPWLPGLPFSFPLGCLATGSSKVGGFVGGVMMVWASYHHFSNCYPAWTSSQFHWRTWAGDNGSCFTTLCRAFVVMTNWESNSSKNGAEVKWGLSPWRWTGVFLWSSEVIQRVFPQWELNSYGDVQNFHTQPAVCQVAH